MNEEYPIHPTLDKLIQAYKAFTQVEFPRGIPQPVQAWKQMLQGLTRYEALVIRHAQSYLSGEIANVAELAPSPEFKNTVSSFPVRTQEDAEYLKKYHDYKNQVEAIAHLVEDCAHEHGNPCTTFRG